jgi:hypothetical protein
VEKTPDADMPREMIASAGGRLMKLEMGAPTGAAHAGKVPAALLEQDAFRLGDFRLGWINWI